MPLYIYTPVMIIWILCCLPICNYADIKHAWNHLYDGCIFLKECIVHLLKTVKCSRRIHSPSYLFITLRIRQSYIISSNLVKGGIGRVTPDDVGAERLHVYWFGWKGCCKETHYTICQSWQVELWYFISFMMSKIIMNRWYLKTVWDDLNEWGCLLFKPA